MSRRNNRSAKQWNGRSTEACHFRDGCDKRECKRFHPSGLKRLGLVDVGYSKAYCTYVREEFTEKDVSNLFDERFNLPIRDVKWSAGKRLKRLEGNYRTCVVCFDKIKCVDRKIDLKKEVPKIWGKKMDDCRKMVDGKRISCDINIRKYENVYRNDDDAKEYESCDTKSTASSDNGYASSAGVPSRPATTSNLPSGPAQSLLQRPSRRDAWLPRTHHNLRPMPVQNRFAGLVQERAGRYPALPNPRAPARPPPNVIQERPNVGWHPMARRQAEGQPPSDFATGALLKGMPAPRHLWKQPNGEQPHPEEGRTAPAIPVAADDASSIADTISVDELSLVEENLAPGASVSEPGSLPRGIGEEYEDAVAHLGIIVKKLTRVLEAAPDLIWINRMVLQRFREHASQKITLERMEDTLNALEMLHICDQENCSMDSIEDCSPKKLEKNLKKMLGMG